MLKILFLIILIIIIFYIINNNLKNTKEHYLTYFLPYYSNTKDNLANFYNDNENNYNNFKKKFNYNIIKFGSIHAENYFIKLFISEFIKNTYNIKVENIFYKSRIDGFSDLINNKINFFITTRPIIYHYITTLNNDITNLRLISNLYKDYIYIFTLRKYNIVSIKNIQINSIIGILNKPDTFYYYYNKFLGDLGYKNNIDYSIKIYNSINELFNALINKECNIIVILEGYPNYSISNNLDKYMSEDIILLPFDIYNETLFRKKNRFIFVDYVDLNNISHSYLPKKFGNYEYNTNKPTLKICYYYKNILANNDLNEEHAYNFYKFLFENYKKINNNMLFKGYKINIKPLKNDIEYHSGVLRFLKEHGYITNTNNDNCKLLVGKMECNNQNLRNNNL
jgi:TRAP-type uncharacterized transport system substrate-binding protein